MRLHVRRLRPIPAAPAQAKKKDFSARPLAVCFCVSCVAGASAQTILCLRTLQTGCVLLRHELSRYNLLVWSMLNARTAAVSIDQCFGKAGTATAGYGPLPDTATTEGNGLKYSMLPQYGLLKRKAGWGQAPNCSTRLRHAQDETVDRYTQKISLCPSARTSHRF